MLRIVFKHTLSDLPGKIEFQLTEIQEGKLLEEFGNIHSIILENESHSFISNLNRHGLIMFRICMILSSLRNIDNTDKQTTIKCDDIDFKLSLVLTKELLKHSLKIHDDLDNSTLTKSDEEFLFSLKPEFKRSEAINIGERVFNLATRTIDDKISQWRKKNIIRKIAHGKYSRSKKYR